MEKAFTRSASELERCSSYSRQISSALFSNSSGISLGNGIQGSMSYLKGNGIELDYKKLKRIYKTQIQSLAAFLAAKHSSSSGSLNNVFGWIGLSSVSGCPQLICKRAFSTRKLPKEKTRSKEVKRQREGEEFHRKISRGFVLVFISRIHMANNDI